MHLLPCACPVGPLEPAPLTALCAAPDSGVRTAPASAAEHSAFWGPDDRYYLRRTVGSTATWWRGDAEGEVASGDDATPEPAAAHAVTATTSPRNRSGGVMRMVLVGRQRGPRHARALAAMHVVVRRGRRTPTAVAPPVR